MMENNNEVVVNSVDKDENLKTLNDNKDTSNHNNDDEIREFMNELRPLYPPLVMTPELLMPKLPSSTSTRKFSGGLNNKRKRESNVKFPNAFIAYRMEFCKQLKNKRICLTMQDVSYYASKLWKKEPCDVKKTYTRLANDAKLLYEKRKKELLLAEEQQQQQTEQSNSINSINNPSLSLNPSPFHKNTQQIFPDLQQHNPIESITISPQLQIPSNSYDFPVFPATDPYNIPFNNPYEDFNNTNQPLIPPYLSSMYYSLWCNSVKPSYDY